MIWIKTTPKNRRDWRSKWCLIIPILVAAVWAVFLVGYMHLTTTDLKEGNSRRENGANFAIIRRRAKIYREREVRPWGKGMYPLLNATFDYDPATVKVMTWNIFGAGHSGKIKIEERAKHVIKTVLKENVDAVLFQELTNTSYGIIRRGLRRKYGCIRAPYSSSFRHYVGTFYKKSRFILGGQRKIPYTNTQRGRLLQMVHLAAITNPNIRIVIMNSHIESFPNATKAREEQLNQCFKIGSKIFVNASVVFGGDMNIEEEENTNIDSRDFKDLWIECGSSDSIKWTWDATRNHMDRDSLVNVKGQRPQNRYDRIYFRPAKYNTLRPVNLRLSGMEKVDGTDLFVSDHWALVATFKVALWKDEQVFCKAVSAPT